MFAPIAITLLLPATCLLIYSLSPVLQIWSNKYQKNQGWQVLFFLICFFIVGYIVFLGHVIFNGAELIEFVLSGILFGGACFVVIISRTSLTTIRRFEEIAEKESYNALHDSLTGLPNRSYLSQKLDEKIKEYKNLNDKFSLLFIDLNNFKDINDVHGHYCGDQILISLSQRFSNTIPKDDFIARIGGDEFAVILNNVNELTASAVSERLQQSIQDPIKYDLYHFSLSMSIGIVLYDGSDSTSLMKKADLAMYHSKKNQRLFTLYETGFEALSQQRVRLVNEMEQAFKKDEFKIYYQPIIDMNTNCIYSVEALMRWYRNNEIYANPEEFINIAEMTGDIKKISSFVIKQSLQDLKQWHDRGWYIHLNINFSNKDFQSLASCALLESQLQELSIMAEYLTLEITENSIIDNLNEAQKIIDLMKKIGVQIAIDDFGTGYSSLSYIAKFACHWIKIDKSFILELKTNSNYQKIVESTIKLAHSLGYRVTAEGVENIESLNWLKGLECDAIQGYYFSKPMSFDDMSQWLDFHFEAYEKSGDASSHFTDDLFLWGNRDTPS